MLLRKHFKEASQHLPICLNLSSESFYLADLLPGGEGSLPLASHRAYKVSFM
jgi:hypothetical protein